MEFYKNFILLRDKITLGTRSFSFDWARLKFSSVGFDLLCRAFFNLFVFDGMKRRKIPLSKTSVAIVRNSRITLANPTGHRVTTELRLFYANHKFGNQTFVWVRLIFFLFGEFDFVRLPNSIELNP